MNTPLHNHGVLSYYELCELLDNGVIVGSEKQYVNASSIDVRLGQDFLIEGASRAFCVDVAARESPHFDKVSVGRSGRITLDPGEFILANTEESFNLPADISAYFITKSSVARCGLEQMSAAWCNPGWVGSTLTLELQNVTMFHTLTLTAGMPIGQMVFFRHAPVPPEHLYSARGSFPPSTAPEMVSPSPVY